MDDNKSPFLSNQPTNNLPKIAKESNFFGNKSSTIAPLLTNEDLIKPTSDVSDKEKPNSFLNKSSLTSPETVNTQPAKLVPENKLNASKSLEISNRSSISSSNINTDNLIKTDGINKTNFNISEIANKNKEIMAIDERIKQFPASQMVKKQQPANVVNNYAGSAGRSSSSGMQRSDTLSGIRNTMRSYPAWRTEMG